MGLLCTNPPYGVRLEDLDAARAIHRELGEVLRERFQGWQAAVLTGAPQLGMELGIRAARTHTLWNGAIECRLLRMTVEAASLRRPGHARAGGCAAPAGHAGRAHVRQSPGEEPEAAEELGRQDPACRVTGSMTPTCRSTRSRSTSTAPWSRSKPGSTCRSTPRPRKSRWKPSGAVVARRCRRCRARPEFRGSGSSCARAGERRAASSTTSSATGPIPTWCSKMACSSSSTSTTIWTRACSSIIASRGRGCGRRPPASASSIFSPTPARPPSTRRRGARSRRPPSTCRGHISTGRNAIWRATAALTAKCERAAAA